MSVAISWANKMQFAKCDITVGFPISSHILYILAQLIATLIHYPCTVALPGLADWSAFLYRAGFANYVKSQLRQWGPWRALDGRYGSNIHPCIRETCLRPSRLIWAYD